MSNSATPAAVTGLADLAGDYPAVLCDVWGVLHNGVRSFAPAREALARYRADGGVVVLITNAPRTSRFVVEQIAGLGVGPESYDAIVTSGDVTRQLLAERGHVKALHVGNERERTLYDGLDLELVDDAEAELVSCTSLFDDEAETPDDYREAFERWRARDLPMICANPDIVVERGEKLVWCAGAIAERYAAIGGATFVAGKPHAPIYAAALSKVAEIRGGAIDKSRVLAIGDGAPTDLKGAYDQGLDVLFVTGGIHAAEFGPPQSPDAHALTRFLRDRQLGARAFLPSLAW